MTEYAIVIDENDQPVAPGGSGLVAFGGPQPLGYYKDEAKTARTFRVIGGKRYVVPGDFARVEEDGKVTLLGRGSNCINTAGEKVFPEEVEEALKTHASVEDALVLGVPDEKWGQAVTGIVVMSPERRSTKPICAAMCAANSPATRRPSAYWLPAWRCARRMGKRITRRSASSHGPNWEFCRNKKLSWPRECGPPSSVLHNVSKVARSILASSR